MRSASAGSVRIIMSARRGVSEKVVVCRGVFAHTRASNLLSFLFSWARSSPHSRVWGALLHLGGLSKHAAHHRRASSPPSLCARHLGNLRPMLAALISGRSTLRAARPGAAALTRALRTTSPPSSSTKGFGGPSPLQEFR